MPPTKQKKLDIFFLVTVSLLLIVGIFAFVSASFGVLAKDSGKFYGILLNQGLGLLIGVGAMWLMSRIKYDIWKKYAFYLLLFSIILVALVFVPGLGFSHGGATRWLSLGPFSFQPVEVFKIAFVVYFSAWLSFTKTKFEKMKSNAFPLFFLLATGFFLLLRQPDTKSLILMLATGSALSYLAGLPKKYIIALVLAGIVSLSGLVMAKPYLLDRVQTFVNPSIDPQGSSFQLQQSLIAIGSGGLFGRGLGQSIQKFSYLPEPQGDSIFAVIGEEFGFVGATFVILLYIMFTLRGFWIAARAPDDFSKLLVSGLIILMLAQSFLNIFSITGLFPLTGVPLVFMSHGGSALIIALASVGVILNVSRHIKK
jgi:cell division protein FtsW